MKIINSHKTKTRLSTLTLSSFQEKTCKIFPRPVELLEAMQFLLPYKKLPTFYRSSALSKTGATLNWQDCLDSL